MIVITGHARCGTQYMAKLYQHNGFDVKHEKLGADGVSSWTYAVDGENIFDLPDRRTLDITEMVHVVRDPFKAVTSIFLTEIPFEKERLKWQIPANRLRHKHVPGFADTFGLSQAILSFLDWNEKIDAQGPDKVVRVESAASELGFEDLTGSARRNTNSRPHREIMRDEWASVDPDLMDRLEAFAIRHGYESVRERAKGAEGIKAYCINMPKDENRRKVSALRLGMHAIPYEFVRGVDGANLGLRTLNSKTLWSELIGCWMSHHVVANRIAEEDRLTLVVEDDINIDVDYREKIKDALRQLPSDFDVALLGWYQHKGGITERVLTNDQWMQGRRWWGFHAYLVNGRKGAEKYLKALDKIETHCDEQLMVHQNRCKVYMLREPLINQSGFATTIPKRPDQRPTKLKDVR